MAKATTRIKHGKSSERDLGNRDKSHLKVVQPGESAPAGLDDETKRIATDEGEEDLSEAYDPDDPESYEGEEAARASKLMAPDNPNRPPTVPGEDSWKVSGRGFLGRDTNRVLSSEEAAEEDERRREAERPRTTSAKAEGSGRKGSKRSSGGSGQATGQSATGDDDKK